MHCAALCALQGLACSPASSSVAICRTYLFLVLHTQGGPLRHTWVPGSRVAGVPNAVTVLQCCRRLPFSQREPLASPEATVPRLNTKMTIVHLLTPLPHSPAPPLIQTCAPQVLPRLRRLPAGAAGVGAQPAVPGAPRRHRQADGHQGGVHLRGMCRRGALRLVVQILARWQITHLRMSSLLACGIVRDLFARSTRAYEERMHHALTCRLAIAVLL